MKRMLKLLLKVIRYFFLFFGYRITKEILNDYEVIRKLIEDAPVKFIDIGANEGQSVDNALDCFNVSLIHSYEPLVNENILNKVQKWGGSLNYIPRQLGAMVEPNYI